MIFISTISVTSFASTNTTKDEVTADDLLKLNSKYQNTKIEIYTQFPNKPQKVYDFRSLTDEESLTKLFNDSTHTPSIKFKSLNEFEAFLDSVEKFNRTGRSLVRHIGARSSSSEINGSYTFKWNSAVWWQKLGLTWEAFVDKNVRVEYSYKKINGKQQFTKAKSASSWISGAGTIVRGWTQRGDGVMNIKTTNDTDDTIVTEVTGDYTLGVNVSVGGVNFNVGLPSTQTWTTTLYAN